MSILITETPTGAKPARRRSSKPEQFTVIIEKLESLSFTVEIRNAAAITQLLDGLESRLAAVEDVLPATRPATGLATAPAELVRRPEGPARTAGPVGGNGRVNS